MDKKDTRDKNTLLGQKRQKLKSSDIGDTGSTNATFINRKKLKKKVHLIYGDRIVIGKTILRFFLEEDVVSSVKYN